MDEIPEILEEGFPNLAVYVDASVLLPLMGVPKPIPVCRPGECLCPLCKAGKMTLYLDIDKADWFYCPWCHKSGNLIELGNLVWDTDSLGVYRRIKGASAANIPSWAMDAGIHQRYEEVFLSRRRRLRDYWDNAASTSSKDTLEIHKLHDQLGLYWRDDTQRWDKQLGRYIGGSTRRNTREALHSFTRRDMAGPLYAGTYELMPGLKWKHILVLPCYSLPNRISGFWFVGRDSNWPNDWQYYRTNDSGVYATGRKKELGLLFYATLREYHPTLKNNAFIISNPALALQIHNRHLRDHGDTLPLAVARDGNEGEIKATWSSIPGKDWVFWSPTPTRSIFAQAKEANGRIAIRPYDESYIIGRHMIWLQQVSDEAVPWQEAMLNLLGTTPDAQVEDIIAGMKFTEPEWFDFMRLQPESVREHLYTITCKSVPKKTLHLNQHRLVVVEANNEWRTKKGVLVSSVVIRIDRMYTVVDKRFAKTIRYAGRILYDREEIHFDASAKFVRGNPMALVERALTHRGVGIPYCNPTWQKRLLDIAIQMSPPYMDPSAAEFQEKNRDVEFKDQGVVKLRTKRNKSSSNKHGSNTDSVDDKSGSVRRTSNRKDGDLTMVTR